MDLAQLVRMHAPAVYALCRALVRDHVLAEDLAQDAFARALAGIDSPRGEASPRAWLLASAHGRCLEHLTRAKRAPWGDEPDPGDAVLDQPAPYDLLANREDAERAMAVLAAGERALVVLHYGHGVGYPELAAAFGLDEGAVRTRVSRALAKMRTALHARMHVVDDEGRVGSRPLAADDETLDFADEEPSGSSSLDLPVLFPALYEEPPATLWGRLEMLTSSSAGRSPRGRGEESP